MLNPVSQVLIFDPAEESTELEKAMFIFGFNADHPVLDLSWDLTQGTDSSSCQFTTPGDDIGVVDRLLGLKLYTPPTASPSVQGTGASGLNSQGQATNKLEHEQKIIAECIKQGVTDKKQQAYILASAFHESDRYQTQTEYASGAQYEGRSDLGNTQTGDGVKYKGRGYVQLTGRRNYKLYSDKTGKDLIGNPEIVAQDQDLSRFILVDGMKNGNFTGAKLGDYVGGNRSDYSGARATVNGSDRAALIAGYAREYETRLTTGDLAGSVSGGSSQPVPPPSTASKVPEVVTTEPPKTEAGGRIHIRVGEFGGLLYEYIYLLSGVTFAIDSQGKIVLTISGVSPLWCINQYQQTDTKTNLTLKQLATQIAKDSGMSLEFTGEGLYYVHLENNGLTPYQLLLREATRAGYTIYNSGTKLVMRPIGPNRGEDQKPFRISITDVLQLTISSKPSGQTPGGKQGVRGAWGKKPVLKTDTKTGNSEQTTPTPKSAGSSVVNSPVKDQGKMSSNKGAVTTGKVDTGEKVISQTSAESEVARIKDFPLDVTLVGSVDYLAIAPCDLITIPNMIQFSTRVGTTEFWVYAVKFTLGSVGFGVALSLYQPGVAVPVAQAMSGGSETGSVTIAPTGTDWAHPYPGSVMTAPWGEDRGGRRHGGQDWAGGNNKILAANSGVVTDVETGCSDGVYDSCGGGYGNLVDIQSSVNGKMITHRYAHLRSVSVAKGQQVQKGQQIGIEGDSGRSRGRHLHFEMREGAGYGFGGTIDPATVGIK